MSSERGQVHHPALACNVTPPSYCTCSRRFPPACRYWSLIDGCRPAILPRGLIHPVSRMATSPSSQDAACFLGPTHDDMFIIILYSHYTGEEKGNGRHHIHQGSLGDMLLHHRSFPRSTRGCFTFANTRFIPISRSDSETNGFGLAQPGLFGAVRGVSFETFPSSITHVLEF